MNAFMLSSVLAIFVSTEAAKPRSVNVAFETVFQFEKTSDVEFLNNIQNFISKVKDVIEENSNRSRPTRRRHRYKFTDFLENLIVNLNTFNDNVLKKVIQIIDTEIRKGNEHNIFQTNIKELLLNKLDGVNIKSAKSIRKNFDNLLKKIKSSNDDKDSYFLGFINTLYKKDSERKLANFIRQLNIFRRSHRKSKALQKTIQKAVQLIIFDHFSNLSYDTKSMVQSQIRDYLNDEYLSGEMNKNSLEYENNVKIKPMIKLHNYIGKKKNDKFIDSPKAYVIKNIKRKRIFNKTLRHTIGTKTYPRIKSTHITYPEILDKRNVIANFRATHFVPDNGKVIGASGSYKYKEIVPHGSKLKGIEYENIPEDTLALSSISHSAEINVNFINNNGVESNYLYRPVKIRASSFKTKNHKSTKSNKRLKYDRQHRINKSKDFYSTPETLVEHFGSLFKNKALKINSERSPLLYIPNKLELNKQNEDGISKDNKLEENKIYQNAITTMEHKYTTGNTEPSLSEKQSIATEVTFENNNVSKLDWYRRAESFDKSKEVHITKVNNTDIYRRELNKKTVVTPENYDISKLLEWYRRAKTDGLNKYENITENRRTATKGNRSYKRNLTIVATSKNVATTKLGLHRRAHELNRLKEENIQFPTNFENTTSINNTNNNLLDYKTTTEKIRSANSNKIISNFIDDEIVTNITEFERHMKENHRKSFFDVTKTTGANTFKTDTNNVNSISKHVTFETNTTKEVTSFDVKSYIKNSDVRNIEDDKKRKEIERKMKQDLDKLFASPAINATTTEAFTDIFEALDDAFDLSPLE